MQADSSTLTHPTNCMRDKYCMQASFIPPGIDPRARVLLVAFTTITMDTLTKSSTAS